MAGYKINSKKWVCTLLCTNDKGSEKEIRETSSFTIATNNIKYLGITLTKEVKELFNKDVKSLKKEFEEDTIEWKALSGSWIGRVNIIKMAILPKQTVDSMKSPSKSQHNSSQTLKTQYSISYGKTKNPG